MKNPVNCTDSYRLIQLVTFAFGITLPLHALAAWVSLAKAPLATSTTSSVKPNVLFILDDSGSMGWDYLPDWANDNHPVSGTNYIDMPELFKNNGFNGLAYNPAITYKPPVHYDASGVINTTTYPSQNGQTTATGADATAKPNWKTVKDDAYGVQATTISNLVGNASYYVFVPGEYCSTPKMNSCVAATAFSTAYPYAAGLRWCDSTALSNCQSINNTTFKYPRYPGLTVTVAAAPATRPTALIRFTGTSSNTGVGSVITANLAGPASVKLGATVVKSINITIGKGRSAAQTASAVAAAIGTGGTVAAYVGGNNITPTCAATNNTRVCLVDNSTYTNGNSVTLGTISNPGSLGVTLISSAGGNAGSPGGSSTILGSNILTHIVPTTTSYTKAATRSDCAGTTCTYTEEMTNYANWWTYYHTRMQAMKTSVSRAFKTIDHRFRVGFNSISYTGATDGAKFLHHDTFELTHKNSWFTKLFASNPTSSTPLRGALSNAGRLYAKKISGQTVDPVQYSCQQNFTILSTDGYWNTGLESGTYGPFNLTGGNVGNLDGGTTARPMKEGTTAVSDTLADIAKYYYDTDLRTSTLGNCNGGISTDFPTGNPDVCTNNVYVSSSDNNVKQHMTSFTMGLGAEGTLNFTSDYENAVSGDFFDLKNGYGTPTVNWSNPIANTTGERIDDLWHAAVNGKGTYFSAKDPDQIITGLNKALSEITNKLGSASSAATSTLNPVAGNNFSFVASYTTVKWKGNLESRSINTGECTPPGVITPQCPDGITNVNAGVISDTATWCVENVVAGTCTTALVADTSGSSTTYNCVDTTATSTTCTAPGVFDGTSTCTTPVANTCIGTMPSRVGAISDNRTIYTAPAGGLVPLSGQNLVHFDAAYATANPAYFSAAHINTLTQWPLISVLNPTASSNGISLINYLRGQNGFEDRAANNATDRLYRTREAVLGDALESQPTYISKPVFSYPYPGYSSFKTLKAGRAGTVYLGANDGMLHAFAADTGIERWAYVPSMVIPDMWRLADTSYATKHHNFMNGDPDTSDVCVANCTDPINAVWKTILVSGLNAGGRGYFALDITNPDVPVLLWEFTPSSGIGSVMDNDLGYSYGQPIVTRKNDGTWVVLVTSGYDNGTLSDDPLAANNPAGNGIGYLYVLDAGTGAIISKIATVTSAGANVGTPSSPSGLAKIAAWNDEPAGNKAGYVYGGDLLGNVWRFDINSTAAATIGNGDVLQFATLFSDAAGTSAQPITTTPLLGKIAGNRVVFIGTGKYLETSDLTTIQIHTQYAIKDDNSNSTFVNPRNTLTQQTLSATTNRQSTGTAPDFYAGRGWFADFPDTGERVNVDGTLVQGMLLVPSIVPTNTICSPGGYGWLNYFNYKTGGVTSVKFDSTIVGLNVIFIAGKPLVEVVTSTDPTPTKPAEQPTYHEEQESFKKKRVIWRELIP